MKIRIGQIFRVEHPSDRKRSILPSNYYSYYELTRGNHSVGADINKGIWAYKAVIEPEKSFKRRPAIILHSNPFKEDSLDVPWIDVIESENGYAVYNGDNRNATSPAEKRGNALLLELANFYSKPELRMYAPPILLFTQRLVSGNRRGYREFSGYGIPTRYILQSQSLRYTTDWFTNLVLELALFNLNMENEEFDWSWIDARRDGTQSAESVLQLAPQAWKLWVNQGDNAIERSRRKVAKNRITSVREQLPSEEDKILLNRIIEYFGTNRYAFEGLASLIAQRVIGGNCVRGWVTKRSGDGGIDFICRLDVGSNLSRTSMVVLGQAKCIVPTSQINSRDLARVVARLQRGWLGVYVTTGVFSEASQVEIYSDKYPLVLVNGSRVAREIRLMMNAENITLENLLEKERKWYQEHVEPVDPERIIDQTMFGTSLISNENI